MHRGWKGKRPVVSRKARSTERGRSHKPLLWLTGFAVALAASRSPGPGGRAAEPEPDKANPAKLALLIGCTQYDNPQIRDLKGPANDIVLMHDLLAARFGFAPQDITVLAEGRGPMFRPTRKNIERAFRELEQKVRAIAESGMEARVVIYFSGHGTRQPDGDQDEPDGWDEVLLPADAGTWDSEGKHLLNAIVDDELGKWTRAIANAPSHLWVIIDACHSGTALRGNANEAGGETDVGEVARFITSRSLGIPEKLERPKGNKARRREREATNDRLVVFYAALPNEKAVERIPYGSRDKKKYGLFTHTMCRVLSESHQALSYDELVTRVRSRYRDWRRKKPNPYAAGLLKQNTILLDHRAKVPITIQRDSTDDRRITIDAGLLRGVTPGSILAVYSPGTQGSGDALIGHVKVTDARPFQSVVQPERFDGRKAPQWHELKDGALCQLKEVDWGTLQITVGFDNRAVRAEPQALTKDQKAAIERVAKVARELTKDGRLPLRIVDSWRGADWVVQWRGSDLLLLPNHLAMTLGDLPHNMTVVRLDDKDDRTIGDVLIRVARAENLLRLASPFASSGRGREGAVRVEWEMYDGKTGRRLEPGVVLKDGQTVRWRPRNVCEHEIYVSVYYLDAAFGVTEVMVWNQPLRPGTAVPWHESDFRTPPAGVEHFLVIATKKIGSQPPPDLSCLVQSPLDLRRPVAMRSWTQRRVKMWNDLAPLERLLATACSHAPRRSAKASDLDAYQIQVFPVEVVDATGEP